MGRAPDLYADSEEHGVFVELRNKRFGLGEASLIAACSAGGTWVFVSDDLDARREASRWGGWEWWEPTGSSLARWPRAR